MNHRQEDVKGAVQYSTINHVINDPISLHGEVTKFGRNPRTNDYYLDSAVTKCLISRNHAEIHRVNFGNKTMAPIQFVLHNHGMNGTFVNNIRVGSHKILQEGDIINFGHTNGINIQPGQHAKQPNSEFCFVFERIERASDGGSETTQLETINSSQNSDDGTGSELNLTALNTSRLLTCTNNSECFIEYNDNANKFKNINRNVNKDLIQHDVHNFSLVNRQNSDDNKLDATVCASESPCIGENGTSPAIGQKCEYQTPILESKRRHADCKILFPNTSTINELTPFDKELMDEVARVSCHFSSDDNDDDDNSTTRSPQIPTFSGLTLPLTSPVTASTRQSKREKVRPPKNDNENVPPTKRKRVLETATKANKKPAKGRKSAVQVYKKDLCSAIDCKKPKKEPIDWVQCDDCDKWYHMLCAGCSPKDVQKSHTEFHCGC